MSFQNDFDSVDNGISRAMETGCMWLNSVFRFKDGARRLFGKRGPRVSKLEAFWGIVCFLLVLGFLIGMYSLVGDGGLFFVMWSPLAMALWSGLALWHGRKIAHMSPLRRRTGEGTGIWLWMFTKKLIVRVSFLIQRPVMYNQCLSRAGRNDQEEEVVECITWIGTARMPRMAFDHDPRQLGGSMVRVELPPRGRAVPTSRRQRRNFLQELNNS